MYSYSWDTETGGLLLNSSPLHFSKEPRPVFSRELDLLGFDQYWNYDRDDSVPLMWAEANNYIYRGRHVATVKGGNLKEKPQVVIIESPEEDNKPLRKVNLELMSQKNASILQALTQQTMKQIYNSFIKYKKKGVDVFYVAFSGGKDSIVTFDLVQKALPHDDFKVLFGDTGMEFPDTYETVNHFERICKELGIEFIRSKSHYSPEFTWSRFGPPATVNRWCCSVHKTAPQILALRQLTGMPNFTGMAFIGVRSSESASRSDYDYISLGEKHKGQWSFNPILEWNSAELFAYIFAEHLYINKAYVKGNRRAGCLVCPNSADRSEYLRQRCYPEEFNALLSSIESVYSGRFEKSRLDQFILNGGWRARKNGRDLNIKPNYEETIIGNDIIIDIDRPKSDWREWIKTIGVLNSEKSPYLIEFQGLLFEFMLVRTNDSLQVKINAELQKTNPNFVKLFKNVFRKTASCIQCRVCEADCPHGALHMENGKLHIDRNCKHCSMCHKVEKGCLIYKSLEQPKGETKMASKSLNCYSTHAPLLDWFTQFFKYKSDFAKNHSLGSNMFDFFKRFLKDAELMNNNQLGYLVRVIDTIGLDNESSWALMFSNLVYSPQFNWFVSELDFNEILSKEYVTSQLIENPGVNGDRAAGDIWRSFTRIADLPFSRVGFGSMQKEKNKAVSITRIPWATPDPRVILYSLYKFSEACGGYYQFTLSRLYDRNVESDGVTPYQIFGMGEEEMKQILVGLQANYADFISTTFTYDLDNINLKEDKTSLDVLSLF